MKMLKMTILLPLFNTRVDYGGLEGAFDGKESHVS